MMIKMIIIMSKLIYNDFFFKKNLYNRAGQTAAREPHVAREPHFYNSKIEGEEGELGHPWYMVTLYD